MKRLILSLTVFAAVFGLSHGASAATNYTVKSGDSLSLLSKNYGVSIDAIKTENHLNSGLIKVGENLKIPNSSGVTLQSKAKSKTYTVKKGDTLWEISMKEGVPISSIIKTNHLATHYLRLGQKLSLPYTVKPSDKKLLERLVTAEAKGEPYAGQVAVATVVLNRVDSSKFPNTIKGVIDQRTSGGVYAFSPVENGSIHQKPTASCKRAVNEAIARHDVYKKTGSLYFYNPKLITDNWILSRKVTVKIGHHVFAK